MGTNKAMYMNYLGIWDGLYCLASEVAVTYASMLAYGWQDMASISLINNGLKVHVNLH